MDFDKNPEGIVIVLALYNRPHGMDFALWTLKLSWWKDFTVLYIMDIDWGALINPNQICIKSFCKRYV